LKRRKAQGPSRRELLDTIVCLKQRITELEFQLANALKNSSTSSKPPSSDIVKPPKPPAPEGGAKRKRGGQPGHPRHERTPFSPEMVDEVHEYRPGVCPDCGCAELVSSALGPRIVQQVEPVAKPLVVTEHRAHAATCPKCGKVVRAPLPEGVEKGGLLGPRLTAQIAWMKGAGHMSHSTVQRYLGDVLGLEVSRGMLAKAVGKVTCALRDPYGELLARLPGEAVLNVDETGHKENGKGMWTWCFRARDYAVFRTDPSRGSSVLREVLGETFGGALGCDYYSAYQKYTKDCGVRVQFCLAHLIRDLKFLATLGGATAAYGERLLEEMRALFHIFHRRGRMGRNALRKALFDQGRAIVDLAIRGAPDTPRGRSISARFKKHGDAYFRFVTTPGLDPTNNLAEQAIRFVVIDRHITQGTRGERGRQWCERIWTVMATCAIQNRSAYEFLADAIDAHFQGRPTPSLLSINP
jgi:transposase